VLTVVAWFLFISPQNAKRSDLRNDMALAEVEVAKLTSRLADLRRDKANIAGFQQQLAQVREALPGTPGLSDLLRQIQAAGAATGFSFTSMAAAPPKKLASTTAAANGAAQAGTAGVGS